MKYVVTRRWYTCQEVEAQGDEEALQNARDEVIPSDEFYDANDNSIEAQERTVTLIPVEPKEGDDDYPSELHEMGPAL